MLKVEKQANLKGYVNFEGTIPLIYSYESVKQCWCIPKKYVIPIQLSCVD